MARLTINGKKPDIACDDETPLLYVLRDHLGLSGPKFGCGLGQCGACTVLVDGRATRSCITPLSAVQNSTVITLEGLGSKDAPHPLQSAFITYQAAQCGTCTNGMIMTAAALSGQNPAPTREEIRTALAGNLCRCGTQQRILAAVLSAFTPKGELDHDDPR